MDPSAKCGQEHVGKSSRSVAGRERIAVKVSARGMRGGETPGNTYKRLVLNLQQVYSCRRCMFETPVSTHLTGSSGCSEVPARGVRGGEARLRVRAADPVPRARARGAAGLRRAEGRCPHRHCPRRAVDLLGSDISPCHITRTVFNGIFFLLFYGVYGWFALCRRDTIRNTIELFSREMDSPCR